MVFSIATPWLTISKIAKVIDLFDFAKSAKKQVRLSSTLKQTGGCFNPPICPIFWHKH